MFGQKQEQDFMTAIRLQHESHVEMVKAFGTMAANVDRLTKTIEQLANGYHEENMTLQTFDQQYRSNGFQFNSIFVSDAAVTDTAKLVVTYGGMIYTITLTAGENILNLPDGANYHLSTTSNKSYPAVLTRYNTLRK